MYGGCIADWRTPDPFYLCVSRDSVRTTPSLPYPVLFLTTLPRLEVTVWVVPSLVENAIAVSFIGLLLGPMFPILMKQSTGILPRWLLTGCLGYIGSIGMAGSAVLRFLTWLLASRFGISSLQPL